MPLPPNRVDYLPIIDRPAIKWPNDARVALWISPNVEHYEYLPENVKGDGILGHWGGAKVYQQRGHWPA